MSSFQVGHQQQVYRQCIQKAEDASGTCQQQHVGSNLNSLKGHEDCVVPWPVVISPSPIFLEVGALVQRVCRDIARRHFKYEAVPLKPTPGTGTRMCMPSGGRHTWASDRRRMPSHRVPHGPLPE